MKPEISSIRCEIDFPMLATLTPSERLRQAFAAPRAVHCAMRSQDVIAVLDAVSRASLAGRWCVGFVAHEAAPAFDAALETQVPAGGPLAWFAEFDAPLNTHSSADSPDVSIVPKGATAFEIGHWRSDVDHTAFFGKVESIRADIREGRFYQVNLTTRLAADFSGNAEAFFRALQAAQPNGYQDRKSVV